MPEVESPDTGKRDVDAPRPGLAGRVAMVTGATRGIGFAVASELAAHGARIIVTGRDERRVALIVARINELNKAEAVGAVLDVTDFARVGPAVAAAVKPYGRLDILVANAGVMASAPLGLVRAEELSLMLDTNVAGSIACVQAAGRIMMRQRGGAIVLVGSIVGRDGGAGQIAYSASKGAVAAAARSAAKELGRWGVRVNAVAPGIIDTDLIRDVPAAAKQRYLASTPLGRLGTAPDVARAIRFLASDDAAFITGHTLAVDGGLVL